jgi:hypothetical protein
MANLELVSMKEVVNFLGLDSEETEDKNLNLLALAVEDWVQNIYCHKKIVSADYTERYDGTGDQYLLLDNYPIISLDLLSIGTDDVISIKNTTTYGYATVSVSSTVVTLNLNGTSSTLALATYTTMTTLVNAINALSSSGWTASLMSSSYASYPSSLLLEKMGLNCINSAYIYLPMPDDGEDNFEVYPNEGKIQFYAGFPQGHRNVYVKYTAGYATIPDDVKVAVLILIKNLYQRRSEESFGMQSYSVTGISVSFEQDPMPMQAKYLLAQYRRTLL